MSKAKKSPCCAAGPLSINAAPPTPVKIKPDRLATESKATAPKQYAPRSKQQSA